MTEEMKKRLEEAAEEYALTYKASLQKTAYRSFEAGAKYGYKEAIAQAKEWLIDNLGYYDYNAVSFGETRWEHIAKDFEIDMNKLWEEKK